MEKDKLQNLTSFFFEIGTLRKIIRMHRQVLLTDDLSDSIASHSYRVAVIGLFLARELEADVEKVLQMCLLHDIAEARSGDQNWIHKRYVRVYEDEIIKDQLRTIPLSEDIADIMREYRERKTKEAKIAKDADLLDQVYLLREYVWQGNQEARKWLKEVGEEGNAEKLMTTQLAKDIAQEIKRQEPNFWWESVWTSENRED